MSNLAKSGMDKAEIRAELKKTRGLQAELARYLDVKEPNLSKILKSEADLGVGLHERIQKFFATKATARYAGTHGPSNVRQPDGQVTVAMTTERSLDPIPVYWTFLRSDGVGADFAMDSGQVALTVQRPAKLADRSEVYGLYVRGNTMSPRYENGELILVEATPRYKKDDHIIVRLRPGSDGQQLVYLKRLVSETVDEIEVCQYNPVKTFTIKIADIAEIHRVLTAQDIVT